MTITITFPDGSKKQFKKGITGLEIAKSISEGLAREALAIAVDGISKDLSVPIEHDAEIKILKFDSPEGQDVFRHSSAHLLAQAVSELFPEAKNTIGPVVEEGFYYDFDFRPFTPEDIQKIEEKMDEIVKRKLPIHRNEITKQEALKIFHDNPYKVEMITEMPQTGTISAYQQGDWMDLCRGPHLQHTGQLKAVKVIKLAGAYWRADAKNKQLQRLYGISFPDKKLLTEYLDKIEEAKKRDHRIIGQKLDLFSFSDVAPGMPFFHPKGMVLKNALVEYWREIHRKAGYVEISTPQILNRKLWETSGHWENYKQNMYTTKIDDVDVAIKPMNCPGGMTVYKQKIHSYKEFPLRMAELGLVHRHELSGVLAGLFRVRAFTQDDAHIYLTEEQITDEVIHIIKIADTIYKQFGFEYHMELSTMPEKHIGTPEQWEKTTNALRSALDTVGKEYRINEGDGAFYGPKIDFHLKDCLGRTWQCATIQLDSSQPINFDLEYDGADGKRHRPLIIHRTVFGSLERFIGILTEHYAGRFPFWISPEQVRVVSVADRNEEYADRLYKELFDAGVRVEKDYRSLTIPKKVRDAQLEQVNFIIVIGDKEQEKNVITVRDRDTNEVKFDVHPSEFLKKLKHLAEKRE